MLQLQNKMMEEMGLSMMADDKPKNDDDGTTASSNSGNT